MASPPFLPEDDRAKQSRVSPTTTTKIYKRRVYSAVSRPICCSAQRAAAKTLPENPLKSALVPVRAPPDGWTPEPQLAILKAPADTG